METAFTIKETRQRILDILTNHPQIRNVFPVRDMPHPLAFTIDEYHPLNIIVFDFCDDTLERAEYFVSRLRKNGIQNSCHPAGTTHSNWPAHVRRRCGISDSLIWFSIDEMDDLETVEILDRALYSGNF